MNTPIALHGHPHWDLPVPASPDLGRLHAELRLLDEPDDEAHDANERDVRLETADGVALAATVFEPTGPAKAVALIAPATGVPRGYYRAFARWLTERGYAALTLDYRGIAGSRGHAGTAGRASMGDWMQLDLPAALEAARVRANLSARRLPIVWIGHSLGGHALAQLPGIELIDAAIGVAAQLPAFHRWPAGRGRLGARFFFSTWVPLCVRLFGHLPGWAIGGGEPLPGPAALDWSRWGQMANYFASDQEVTLTAGQWRGVAHLWCISDDWIFGPAAAVEALKEAFSEAPGQVHVHHVTPQDVGMQRLGHFGPFRRAAGKRLWPLWLERIEAAVPVLRSDNSVE